LPADFLQERSIISASRRSDIPAFFGEWFLQSVRQGYAELQHPFHHRKLRISLKPEQVAAFVFWSKNYQPFLDVLESIKDLYQGRFLFHFTINGFTGSAKAILEPRVPSEEVVLETVAHLANNFGSDTVIWRFDPIFFSNLTPPEERLASFARLAQALRNKVQSCYISLLDLYSKVRRRMQQAPIKQQLRLCLLEEQELWPIMKSLRQIADSYGIQVFTCCENRLAEAVGFNKGHCIDSRLLQKLYPAIEFTQQISPTRPECGCYASIDIGSYYTCQHHCLYCYANK
jgi:DNA repair photolyase